jgi:hypothetical protein
MLCSRPFIISKDKHALHATQRKERLRERKGRWGGGGSNETTANKKYGVSFNTIFPVYDVTAKKDNKSII